MSGHYIAWTISHGSFGVDVTIECREPADADCRTHCPNCEEWCHAEDPTRCGNYGCGETLVTGAECNAVLFMEDVIESYGGPDDEPIRDGLVEVEWDGDGYTWHYPEPDDQPTGSWLFCTPEEREQRRRECGPHRGPQGPNEDISQCLWCGMPSHSMRPAGETFGDHLPDCSLPVDHESFCQPGGSGHPTAEKVRG